MLLQIHRNKVDFASEPVLAPSRRMSHRSTHARRTLAAGVLLLLLAALAIEIAHAAHHDVGGVASERCSTCVAARAPLVPQPVVHVGAVSVVAGRWYQIGTPCDPTSGVILAPGSRGPPARG